MRAGRDVEVAPDVFVREGRDGLLRYPPGRNRLKRGGRYWYPLAESRLCGLAFRGSQLRISERPRVGIRLEQPVIERRQPRKQDVRLCEISQRPKIEGLAASLIDA